MALNVQQGLVSVPTSDATRTITLPAGFNPKAIIVNSVQASGDGSSASVFRTGIGFGTFRGGTPQQGYVFKGDNDASATAVSGQGVDTDKLLRGYGGGGMVLWWEVAISSWSDTEIVLSFTNATNNVGTLQYLVLGGSDISDAYVGSFALATGVATQDVPLPAGFGHPDLIGFLPAHSTALGATGSVDAQVGMGWAKSATERYCSIFHSDHGHTTNEKKSGQKARAILTFADNTPSPTTFDAEADLADRANWPTDNFRLSYADQAGRANRVIYLALKGSLTATIGGANTLTAGSTQDLPHGATPKGMLALTTLVADAAGGIQTNTAQLGGISVGFSDLTNEAACACGSDDGQATSVCWHGHSTSKVVYTLDQPTSGTAAPVERARADASVSGTDLRLTYSTLDNVARRFGYLILGDGPAAPIEKTLTPATETDGAQPLSFSKPIRKGVIAAAEADAAQPLDYELDGPTQVTITPAAEADQALALDVDKPILKTLTSAAETDTPQLLSVLKPIYKTLVVATEADAALSLEVDKPVFKSLVPAAELAQALALAVTKPIYKDLPLAVEFDEARVLSITGPIRVSLTPALETDTAQLLLISKPILKTLTPALELDEALAFQLGTDWLDLPGPTTVQVFDVVRTLELLDRAGALDLDDVQHGIKLDDRPRSIGLDGRDGNLALDDVVGALVLDPRERGIEIDE